MQKKFILLGVVISLHMAQLQARENRFEGAWESCFRFSKQDSVNYARYGRSKICSNFLLLQKGTKICGTWQYFANQIYPGKVEAVLTSPTTAKSVRLCGRPGEYTEISCEDGRSLDAKDIPLDQWDQRNTLLLTLYRDHLFVDMAHPDSEPVSDSDVQKRNLVDGLPKRLLTYKEKQALAKDPSIQSCLNDSD